MSVTDTTPGFRIRGWHVLVAMILFFGIITAVNAVMITLAIKSFPGQVSVTPYEDGVAYNRKLAQIAAQRELGWQAGIAPEQSRALEVQFRDKDGRPLEGLTLTGKLERPATETGRLTPKFRAIAPGSYQADITPASGAWDVSVTARDKDGHVFEAERRVTWP